MKGNCASVAEKTLNQPLSFYCSTLTEDEGKISEQVLDVIHKMFYIYEFFFQLLLPFVFVIFCVAVAIAAPSPGMPLLC